MSEKKKLNAVRLRLYEIYNLVMSEVRKKEQYK